jgi:hypothetical protein
VIQQHNIAVLDIIRLLPLRLEMALTEKLSSSASRSRLIYVKLPRPARAHEISSWYPAERANASIGETRIAFEPAIIEHAFLLIDVKANAGLALDVGAQISACALLVCTGQHQADWNVASYRRRIETWSAGERNIGNLGGRRRDRRGTLRRQTGTRSLS